MILYIFIVLFSILICFCIYLRMTIKYCESNVCMVGKVVIVTGANAGIGFKIAECLAGRGARVILACRNEERATRAKNEIINATGNNHVEFKHLDLASLSSVRKFCEEINKTEEKLDILINNAGVADFADRYTDDGIIEMMQVNYFGPFLLTWMLLPLLQKSKPSRIINVSSIAHIHGVVEIGNLNIKGHYHNVWAYSNSKLLGLIYTVELARRLKGTGVVVNAVHPGTLYTDMAKNGDLNWFLKLGYRLQCWVCYRTLHEAAQTPLYLAIARECETITGKYYVDCEPWPMRRIGQNKEIALELWKYSKRLVQCNDDNLADLPLSFFGDGDSKD